MKAKYNRGHALYHLQRWVFEINDTTTKQGYITFVNNLDQNTLLPIIEEIILPGRIIHSDQWRASNGIMQLPDPKPYRHLTVNHVANFVDPFTRVHTNHVEAMWTGAKRRFKIMNGTTEQMVPSSSMNLCGESVLEKIRRLHLTIF